MKPIIAVLRFYMRLRHGVRGAIKPPINWNRTNSPWYRWRYRCWQVEARLYNATGLPDKWWSNRLDSPGKGEGAK